MEEIRKEGEKMIYGRPSLTDNEREVIAKMMNDELFECNLQCLNCPLHLKDYKETINPFGKVSSCIIEILEGRCEFL